jgi:two-component system, sensor histidine kinase
MTPALFRHLRDTLFFPVNSENLRIRSEQIRVRLNNYPTMIGGQVLLVVLFVWMLWDVVPHRALLWWAGIAYCAWAIEALWWRRYRQSVETVRDCNRWHIAFTLFTAFFGLMWGGTVLWLFPADPLHQVLLMLVLMGLAAASVSTNSTYPSSFYIFLLCVITPLLLRTVLLAEEERWAITAFISLYLAVLLKAGWELGNAFQMALRQRFENEHLVAELVKQQVIANRALQDAETASREKSRFLAAASHDLRQPLQALTLFSEALTASAGDKDTRRLAGQIGKSVHALADMFNELLDLSRLDAGIMTPHWQHFALQPLLDRLYVNFAPLAQAKKLGFEIPIGDDLPYNGPQGAIALYSDPFLLERVLRNLLSNAVRYTDAGKVTLRCLRSGEGLKFEVADTGIGTHAETLPHIFEEYYQADNPHRDRRKGLGLGLAIVRRIEKLLDCKIEVISEPGRGSTFACTVALGDAAQLAHPFAITHSRHDLAGTTVALVEDDPDIRHIAAELMGQWGCRVFAGELPEEVMRGMDVGAVRPDLLVCDYRLPQGLTAIHAIAQMRELWGNDIPAMVLTGDTAPQVLHEIQASGAMLLHKPITPARLRSMMYLALHGSE